MKTWNLWDTEERTGSLERGTLLRNPIRLDTQEESLNINLISPANNSIVQSSTQVYLNFFEIGQSI